VDLLVEFDEPTFDRYMDLKDFLEGLLGRRVDLVTEGALKPRLRPIVLAEAVHAKGLWSRRYGESCPTGDAVRTSESGSLSSREPSVPSKPGRLQDCVLAATIVGLPPPAP
jgi:hypothetical protein